MRAVVLLTLIWLPACRPEAPPPELRPIGDDYTLTRDLMIQDGRLVGYVDEDPRGIAFAEQWLVERRFRRDSSNLYSVDDPVPGQPYRAVRFDYYSRRR